MNIFGKDYDTDDLSVISSDINERWANIKKWQEEDNARQNKTINDKANEIQLLHKVLLELSSHPSHVLGEGVKRAMEIHGISVAYKDGAQYLVTKQI